MIFATLFEDDAVVASHQGKGLLKNGILPEKGVTWEYNPLLDELGSVFVQIYCNKATLSQACSKSILPAWHKINKKVGSFFESYKTIGLDFNEHGILEILPDFVLEEYLELQVKIIEHIHRTHAEPTNYEHMLQLHRLLEAINNQEVSIADEPQFILYNPYGSVTGRLTHGKTSFPIMNIKKENRGVVKPSNDYFIDLDFNGVDFRCLYGIMDQMQPQYDIYEDVIQKMNLQKYSRDDIKKRTFAWLYGEGETNIGIFNKKQIRDRFWLNGHIENVFGRRIKCNSHHSISYLVQSTSADLFYEQLFKLRNFLKNKKTKIAFMIHDEVCFDYSEQDGPILDELVEIFSNTRFGKFLVNIKTGYNFGDMK